MTDFWVAAAAISAELALDLLSLDSLSRDDGASSAAGLEIERVPEADAWASLEDKRDNFSLEPDGFRAALGCG
jgi:hypothetical protein